MKTKSLTLISIGFICLAVIVGCDKKRGCTDPFSDNYDPEAVQDDDTCVKTRLKFVGEYDGYGTIETGQDTLVSYDQIGINIVDSTAVGQDGLIIGISNFDAQLYALSATVTSTYGLTINFQQIGVYSYWGEGNINGRVLELNMTRTEEITLPDESTYLDTLFLNLYGLQELEE